MYKLHRNIFLTTLFIFICSFSYANTFSSIIKSNNSDSEFVSDFNENEIYNLFTEIDELSKYVEANENITYSDLETTGFSLSQLSSNSNLAFFSGEEENRFTFDKQTAFLAGCIFGVLGIVAVAVVNNGDQERLNSSIWGCVASGCISGGSVIAFFVFFIAASSGLYYW